MRYYVDGLLEFLVLLFVMAIPIENMIVFPLLGTVSRFLGLFVGTIFILRTILSGKFRISFPVFHMILIVFCIFLSVSFLWSSDQVAGFGSLKTIYQILFMLIIISSLRSSRIDQKLMLSYLIGCYATLISIFVDFRAGQLSGLLRFTAKGFDPNDAALLIAIGIPLALALLYSKSLFLVLTSMLYIPVSISAVFLTASRGGILSLFPSLFYIVFSIFGRKDFKALLAFVLVLIGAVSAIYLSSEWVIERVLGIGSEILGGDISLRKTIWDEGMRVFQTNPLLGGGIGSFRISTFGRFGFVVSPHSSYIPILVENGIVGFSVFLSLIFYVVLKVSRGGGDRILSLVILSTWAIGASALFWEFKKATWFVLMLVIIYSARDKRNTSTADVPHEKGLSFLERFRPLEVSNRKQQYYHQKTEGPM